MKLDSVIVETGPEPAASIIWLHGLGADGHDFEPIVPELRLPESLPLRFIFPHAPVQPVTLNGGMQMRAWFDIYSLEKSGPADSDGIDASCSAVEALVDAELAAGVPKDRIVIAGFSQGGVIAMHTALRSDASFAALMVLSSYLPLSERLSAYPDHTGLPLFLAHGEMDPVLPLQLGVDIKSLLTERGLEPEWHTYMMAHGVCPQEIGDIRAFLLRALQT